MMSDMALSLPKRIILRKLLRIALIPLIPLIATFVGVVASGMVLLGYVFKFVLL